MKPLLGALALCALPMAAQATCYDYPPLQAAMIEGGARFQGGGDVPTTEGGASVHLWVHPNGNWALFAINEIGIACLIVAGEGWTTPERA